MFRPDIRHLAILFLLSVYVFSIAIGEYDVWPADEPRFAEVGREMYQSGNYLTLTVNGENYTEKPPLLFWMMAGFANFFGDVNEEAARLPSVVAAVAGILLTYGLAARMFGPRTGLWSAMILMTCFRYWWQARTAQTDMLLTGWITGSMYCLWRWDVARKARWLVVAYICLTAALFTKGPPALVFVLLGTWTFYWVEAYSRKQTRWLLGSCVALFLVALWFVPARLLGQDVSTGGGADVGMAENIFRNTIGRMFLGTSKVQPPWYYLTTIPSDLMPWTIFLPWVLAKAWRERKDNRAMYFLLAWTVPALIFFSISIGKRATYILPLFPVFAILTARGVLEFMDGDQALWRKRLMFVWAGGLALLGALLEIAPKLTVMGQRIPAEHVPRVYLFGGLLLLSSAYAFLRQKYASRSPLHRVMLGQMVIIWLSCIGTIFPVINVFQSARDFCAPLRALSESGEHYRLYSVGFTREAYIYYAKHFHAALLTDLLGAEGLSDREIMKVGKVQKNAKKLIQDAVDGVPVANVEAVTPAEIAALRAAIDQAMADAGGDADAMRKFEGQLRAVLDGFGATFGAADPAFFFVQDDDWRWVLPLQSAPPAYFVVRQQQVGSREVLLIANAAGKALLERKTVAASALRYAHATL